MTRALVTQLVEALEYAFTGNRRPEILGAAITAARAYLETEPSGERAELIVMLRNRHLTGQTQMAMLKAADMLEADAQQANKPTGWDNGLLQDYCAEFGQWLASRPGARQQIKAMFDTSTPLQP